MKQIVYSHSFPKDLYVPVESEAQEVVNVSMCRYSRIRSTPIFWIYRESFSCPPTWIKNKIVAEIDAFQQYKQDMFVADRAYIFQTDDQLNIFLRTRFHKSRTLESVIQANKHAQNGDIAISKMKMLAEAVYRLHQNKHCHGRIKLSNIICRKDDKVKLGMPAYLQIQKWKKAQHSSYQLAPQDTNQADIHTSSDIFALGLVFLQMMIGQVLPQSMPLPGLLAKLSRVQGLNIPKLIMLMLRQQINIRDILKILGNPKVDMESIDIKDEDQKKYNIFKFFLFHQSQTQKINKAINANTNIVKLNAVNLGPIVFIFSENDNLFVKIITKNFIEIIADLTPCFLQKKKKFPWFNLENFQKMISDGTTKFDLSIEGDLLVLCLIDTVANLKKPKEMKQIQTKLVSCSMPAFNNTCIITGQSVRKGLIATEQIVVTVIHQHQIVKMTDLSFDLPGAFTITAEKYDGELSEVTDPLKYTIICANFCSQRVEFQNYLKLVSNYSEVKVKQKIAQINNGMILTYQLGDITLVQGQILFYQNSFQLSTNKIDLSKIVPGEPLRITLPMDCSPTIGIHVKDGKGFLINDNYQSFLYRVLSQCRSEASLIKESVPFIIIESDNLNITQGNIRNINDSAVQRFMQVNSIRDKKTAYAHLQLLESHGQNNFRDIGFYHYLIGIKFDESDYKIFHLELALQYFSSIYPQNGIIFALIYKKMGDKMMQVLGQNRSCEILSEGSYKLAFKCLQQSHSNYYTLLSIILSIVEISQGGNAKLQSLKHAFMVCNIIHFHQTSLKVKVLVQLLELRQLLSSQQTEAYAQISIPSYDFRTAVARIKENIIEDQFDLVSEELNQLILIFGQEIQEKKEMEDQFIKVWKTAYLQFMIYCNDLAQLAAFEDFSNHHVNHCYVHAALSFRNKVEIIKAKNSQQSDS